MAFGNHSRRARAVAQADQSVRILDDVAPKEMLQ